MTSVPEGLLAGKGQESADAYPASGQFQVPLTMCLEEQRCEGLSGFGNVLFNSVSCGDLRQVCYWQKLTYGGFSFPFLGWQSSVKAEGMGFGVGQA